ncbi:MAG: hypothetical protein ABI729_10985 [Chitinophagales bacterium]
MKLSEHNNKTLMLAIHKLIEGYADDLSDKLEKGNLNDFLIYPPNCGFTNNEQGALLKLKSDSDLKSGLRKVIASSSACVIFDLFSIIDGTADPDPNLGKWTEISFIDKTEDIEEPEDMLHDNFFETYWDWKEVRPQSGWTLDTYEDKK